MAHEDRIWRMALDLVQRGERVVLCTVIRASGSTPREVGARMLVGERGVVAGTVGGGCGEAEVLVSARKAIAGFQPQEVVEVDLSGELSQTQIQACGGTMMVAVSHLDAAAQDFLQHLANAEARQSPIILEEVIDANAGVTRRRLVANEDAFLKPGQDASCVAGEGRWRLQQRVGSHRELIVVGSGHVAQPLVEMAALVGYRVVVMDDRPALANQHVFPKASQILLGQHADLLGRYQLRDYSAVCIITRGHQYDMDSLRAALQQSPRYIGMIGSRRRALETLRAIHQEGVAAERLETVHSPIGLDIGAQSPEEIALAIMAEVVRSFRGGSGMPLLTSRPPLFSKE